MNSRIYLKWIVFEIVLIGFILFVEVESPKVFSEFGSIGLDN